MQPKGHIGLGRAGECGVGGPAESPEQAIARLAAGQRGVVTLEQLIHAGIGRGAIKHRARSGRLRQLHRGVYLVGPVMPRGAREMAAVLACGDRAYLSHHSAARLHRLLPLSDKPCPVHVTVCGRQVNRPNIVVHRVRSIERDEVMTLAGIPITTPSRTTLDLAATMRSAPLERLVAEAYALNLTSRPKLLKLLDRHQGRPGTPALRSILDADNAPARTRSDGERLMLALLRRAELPLPRANTKLHGYEADFLWPDRKLVVEVDGYAAHSSPASFERDRRKDAEYTLRGYRVLRITWRELRDRPEAVVARLGQALAHGSSK